jgi:uncharacterized 2Fe-2S/4Fe-4S cluster protein (DUF4445 family)
MPDSKEVWVVSGSTIKEALLAASIPISMPCGGHGRCGKCVVHVEGKVAKPDELELARLPSKHKSARLACMCRVIGDAEVTIPASTRVSVQQISVKGKTSGSYRFDPGLIKVFLGRRDKRSMERLRDEYCIGIEDIALNMSDLRLMDLPLRMDHDWRLGLHTNVTLVATRNEIVGFEAGDTSSECYGIAIDVGTNTVVCSAVDLSSGKELATVSTLNPQVIHGDDVISRIRYAKTSGGLRLLQHEIVNLINGVIQEMTHTLGVDRKRIYLCSAVGNTAMQHILVGLSPVDLGRAPYRAKLVSSVEALAIRSGLHGHSDCRLLMPPPIGGFVGGDLVALVISQSLHRRRVPTLAIDLGTNGEVVLAAGGRLAACSTAAGPAFEGERISCGVRAIEGAIEDVRVTGGKMTVKTIGNARPVGLCGSGLIATIAELLRLGVIQPSGRMRPPEEIEKDWLAERVKAGEAGREFVVTDQPEVSLRQGDIREVQLGKAAICAGIKVLCSATGTELRSIRTVLVSGSFGSALKPSNIRRLGMLPPGMRARIKVIGNSAIEGAKIFLTSRQARQKAEELAEGAEHIELFSRSEFKDEFYDSIGFPVKLRE